MNNIIQQQEKKRKKIEDKKREKKKNESIIIIIKNIEKNDDIIIIIMVVSTQGVWSGLVVSSSNNISSRNMQRAIGGSGYRAIELKYFFLIYPPSIRFKKRRYA